MLTGVELQRLQADLAANRAAIVRWKSFVDAKVGGTNFSDIPDSQVAMMGVITGAASYCNFAVPKIDTFLDGEAARIQTGTPPLSRRDHYLDIGYYVGEVALVYDYCHANLTATQKLRWGNYADQALFNLWNQNLSSTGLDNWGVPSAANNYSWARDPLSGLPEVPKGDAWSIDNPSNNYYYSFLRATMLWGVVSKHESGRPLADQWLNKFRIEKLENQLKPVFNAELVGGGSREGTGYGTAMGRLLFDVYYLWEKTTGERISLLNPHTEQSMPYMMHALAPDKKFLANIGDQSRDKTGAFYTYHREKLLILSGLFTGTPMARSLKDFLATSPLPVANERAGMMNDALHDRAEAATPAQLNTSYFASGIGHFFDRSSWSPNATWLTMLVGPYTESHAHMDGLSFQLYKNGRWLVQDANAQGRNGLQNEQTAHALVRQSIPGGEDLRMYARQADEPGGESKPELKAMAVKPHYTYVAAGHGTLFNHPSTGNPGVSLHRELVYIKPDTVIVYDRANYTGGTSVKTFQLPLVGQQYRTYYDNAVGNIVRTNEAQTPILVDPVVTGRSMTYNNGSNSLTVMAVAPESSQIAVIDMYATYGVNEYLFGKRFDSSVTSNGLTHFLNVLSVDGAVSAATRGSNDGQVTVTLADGRVVVLAFNLAGQGGTIQIRNAAGQIVLSESLPTTVTPPPVLDVPTVQLSVALAGGGSGSVSSVPSGIACGTDCSESVAAGTSVTLTAVPAQGSTFTGWTGVACVGGNSAVTCALTVTTNVTATATFVPDAVDRIVRFDFTDDSRSDILLRNATTGENYLYPMSGTTILAGEGYIRSVPAPWAVAGVGDFDGDGRSDILWRNGATGENYIYFMDGRSILASEGYIRSVPTAWSVGGIGDFNGDGRADILWRNTTTGENYLYFVDGKVILALEGFIRSVPGAWSVATVADFDADGKADILWRNGTTGENYLYFMDGRTIRPLEGPIRTVPANWIVAGSGDMDGDGRSDILWRNTTTGENYVYFMDGRTIKPTEGFIRAVATAWSVASIGDFDGDGKSDVLWRNGTTGENYLYFMDGRNIKVTEGYIRTAAPAWSVVSK